MAIVFALPAFALGETVAEIRIVPALATIVADQLAIFGA